MSEPEQPTPDEVAEQPEEEKEEAKEAGTKYTGGEIPKAPADKKK